MRFPVGTKVNIKDEKYPETGIVEDTIGDYYRIVRVPRKYKGDDGLREVLIDNLRSA